MEDGEIQGLEVVSCVRCPRLVESRSRIVNGVGPEDAELLVVGEAPGAQEDREGEPFVGRSGQLLTSQLAAAGLDREDVRITNCIRCRPPENRDPTTQELENCRPWLAAEIEGVDPDVILAVGKVPASRLLRRDVAVTAEAGQVESVEIGSGEWPVVISVHPAATLYDRSLEETFTAAVRTAANRVGPGVRDEDQTGLGDF